MKAKRIICLGLILALAVSYTPAQALAGETKAVTGNKTEDVQDILTKAILKVKEKVDIPEEYSEFSYYNYDSCSDDYQWRLFWNNSNGEKQISVVADNEGNIFGYCKRDYEDKTSKEVNFLQSELEETAYEAVLKMNPCMKEHLKLVSCEYSGVYQNTYDYTYVRVENGIEMPDHTVRVEMNVSDGSLVSYSCNWLFDIKIPDNQVNLTREEAAKQINNSLTMKLKYESSYQTDESEKETVKAYLVYEPDDTYLAVDAKTGKLYTTRSEWNIYDSRKVSEEQAAADTTLSTGNGGLTEKEVKAVEELGELITKDQAIRLIQSNGSLLLDSKAIEVSAKLLQRTVAEKEEKDYYWVISFSDPREPDYENNDCYRFYASATMDARTGELRSYYASTDCTETNCESIYTKAACQKRLEKFLNAQNTERFANVKLYESNVEYQIEDENSNPVNLSYHFNYVRYHENVPYEDNYIHASVDTTNGKIISYYYNWNNDVSFESTKDVMGEQEAKDAYLALDEFNLRYEVNTVYNYDLAYSKGDMIYDSCDAYSVEYEVRLVYSTQEIYPHTISPFTGKQIDYQGNEILLSESVLEGYSDIKGNEYERSIQILHDLGLEVEGGKFYPDKLITGEDFLKFCSIVGLYANEDLEIQVKDSKITNVKAARYLVTLLGYENIAAMQGIFTTGYLDENKVESDDVGFVALAKGLGLSIAYDDALFVPYQRITRGKAAQLMIEVLKKIKF